MERMIFLGPIPPRKGKFFEEFGAALIVAAPSAVGLDSISFADTLPITCRLRRSELAVTREPGYES
ncbi:MAG: hypothetical protein ABI837_03965 [Acidobacteriota bacterium]